jgi:hypothetical protein
MTKSFLPEFQSLLPDYQNWLEAVADNRSKNSLKAAIKVLKSVK